MKKTILLTVGDGTANAVSKLKTKPDLDHVFISSDSMTLRDMDRKGVKTLHIGKKLTKGLGTGADPAVGKSAAVEQKEDITKTLSPYRRMIILVALGGGTGCGATEVVLSIAKNLNIDTTIIASLPLRFEGKMRMDKSLRALDTFATYTDSILVLPYQEAFDSVRLQVKKLSMKDVFNTMDDFFVSIVRMLLRKTYTKVELFDLNENIVTIVSEKYMKQRRLRDLFAS